MTETVAKITQEIASGSAARSKATEWIAVNSGPVFGGCRVYDCASPLGERDPNSPSSLLDASS